MKKFLFLFAIIPFITFGYTSPGKPTGFVNDFVSILNTEQKNNLEGRLADFEKSTSNEISVVIIKSLEGDSIENFAEKLFQEWGIGKKEENNGVLLLIAIEDRKMRVEVGYGLEGVLTDLYSSRIIRETLTPAFQAGDFFGGIDKAVDQIIQITQNNIPSELQKEKKGSNFNLDYIWIVFVGFLWLSSILARSKSWWAGGIVGGIIGTILSIIYGFIIFGIISLIILIPLGFLFDFLVSRTYSKSKSAGINPPWWIGGGRSGGLGGGGFGGFSGGSSGGGGSSGSW